MNTTVSSYSYKTGVLNIKVRIQHDSIHIDPESASFKFQVNRNVSDSHDFSLNYSIDHKPCQFQDKPVFTGKSFEHNEIPYEWYIYEFKDHFSLVIKFKNNLSFKSLRADIFLENKEATIHIEPGIPTASFPFDPFFHPFGAIILNYISYFYNGILIHASGVTDNDKGYVFTAVSGTGKSTMARLWKSTGAQVINDDRLILISKENNILMTNTPMPHYQDIYKENNVSAIFLINQSPSDYLKPLTMVNAVAGLMSNCIQFLYNKHMVKQHLNTITTIAERCPVYELGFKPTTKITDIIKNEFGR